MAADFREIGPSKIPGESLTPEDMARVTDHDWTEIRSIARGYCRKVDATRSRKLANGSATVTKNGYPLFGTDDASDDTAQDSVLIYAQRLRDVIARCEPSAESGTEPESQEWVYVRRDGEQMVITRATLRRWAVRDAAQRNGYRVTQPPADDALRALLRDATFAQNSAVTFRTAWGNGSEFPTLRQMLETAEKSDDLRRAGVFATVAQECHGGAYGSRRQVIRTRRDAEAEWRELSSRLDEARESFATEDQNNA
ncbi:hypothetical protein [Actinomadura oligospora]|uniref:hypothetical protein n=1 Tax=Actinomadura oligospora TaxID=111804 RepID=UPI00047DCED4|nr:hypothetical protein [Actinomadura oligospora]